MCSLQGAANEIRALRGQSGGQSPLCKWHIESIKEGAVILPAMRLKGSVKCPCRWLLQLVEQLTIEHLRDPVPNAGGKLLT